MEPIPPILQKRFQLRCHGEETEDSPCMNKYDFIAEYFRVPLQFLDHSLESFASVNRIENYALSAVDRHEHRGNAHNHNLST